ncbi:MAG: RC-LH1 core complex protein PufX [Pseudomonadota bacterium]
MLENKNASVYNAETPDREMIRADITGQMLKGAVVGGVVFFGPIVFIVALYYLGLMLPAESKDAADPTPDSFVLSGNS